MIMRNLLATTQPQATSAATITTSTRPKRIATVKQVSSYLKVCRKTVGNLTKAGKLPAYKIGKCIRYDLDAVDRYIDTCIVR